jgi:hypothetical protein
METRKKAFSLNTNPELESVNESHEIEVDVQEGLNTQGRKESIG